MDTSFGFVAIGIITLSINVLLTLLFLRQCLFLKKLVKRLPKEKEKRDSELENPISEVSRLVDRFLETCGNDISKDDCDALNNCFENIRKNQSKEVIELNESIDETIFSDLEPEICTPSQPNVVSSYASLCISNNRDTFEDRYFASCPFKSWENLGIFCVFDGFGGYEVAEMCKASISSIFDDLLRKHGKTANMKDVLLSALEKLDERISSQNCGSTASLVIVWKDMNGVTYVQSGNVGDSSAFLTIDNENKMITVDQKNHSKVNRTLAISSFIGGKVARNTCPNIYKFDPIISEPIVIPAKARATIAVCSDGITDMNKKDFPQLVSKIGEFLSSTDEVSKIAVNLVETAMPKTEDNITAIIARIN